MDMDNKYKKYEHKKILLDMYKRNGEYMFGAKKNSHSELLFKRGFNIQNKNTMTYSLKKCISRVVTILKSAIVIFISLLIWRIVSHKNNTEVNIAAFDILSTNNGHKIIEATNHGDIIMV